MDLLPQAIDQPAKPGGANQTKHFEYSYNPAQQISALDELTANRQHAFEYDDRDQLTRETVGKVTYQQGESQVKDRWTYDYDHA